MERVGPYCLKISARVAAQNFQFSVSSMTSSLQVCHWTIFFFFLLLHFHRMAEIFSMCVPHSKHN